MQMYGKFEILQDRQTVWEALNNVDTLRACIPGCEELEYEGDNTLRATLVLRIGPIKTRFKGQVVITDVEPLHSYRISGAGSGGVAGGAKGSAHVTLSEIGQNTLLAYEVNSSISGKIAQLGTRLIDATSKKLAAEFFSKFSALVSQEGQ